MPDPINALAQSPPQFAQPSAWPQGNAQPAPNYDDAISQAWHQSYSQNNPVEYEANYRAPSAYGNVTAALHHLAQSTDPFGGASSDPNPVRAAGRGLGAAVMGMPAVAAPVTAYNALTSALSPTTVGSAELSAGDQRKQQIRDLEAKITAEQGKRDAALNTIPRNFTVYDAHGNQSRGRDPSLISAKTSAFNDNINAFQKRLDPLYQAESEATSTQEKAEAPFAVQHPYLQAGFDIGGPTVSALTGLGIGRGAMAAIRAGAKPLKAVAGGLGLSGLAGFIEGDISGSVPVNVDLDKPQGTPTYKNALNQLPTWLPEQGWLNRTNVGPFLSDRAVRKGLQSAGTGSLAALGAMHNALRGLAGTAAETSPAVASSAATEAPAAGRPQPLYTDAQGREIHVGATGTHLRQDKIGRWIDNMTGRLVSSEKHPLWVQSLRQSGNALQP